MFKKVFITLVLLLMATGCLERFEEKAPAGVGLKVSKSFDFKMTKSIELSLTSGAQGSGVMVYDKAPSQNGVLVSRGYFNNEGKYSSKLTMKSAVETLYVETDSEAVEIPVVDGKVSYNFGSSSSAPIKRGTNPDLNYDYYPAFREFGTYAFEDKWPIKGDYDLNDVVIDYNYEIGKASNGELRELNIIYSLRASGAANQNGFGIQLENIAKNNISTISINSKSVNYESVPTKPVIIIYDNVKKAFNDAGYFEKKMYNTDENNSFIYTTEPVSLNITFNAGNNITSTEIARIINPFIFRSNDKGIEVHLKNYLPTDFARTSLFNNSSYDDRSDIAKGITYTADNGLPWGLDVPDNFYYPNEVKNITDAYLDFADWAISQNTRNTAWYNGRKNQTLINSNGCKLNLVGIAVKTLPSKTTYLVGDVLDLTGLLVEGTYFDGTKKDEVITRSNISGFDSTTAGTKTITITLGAKRATFNVTVNNRPIVPTLTLSDPIVTENTNFKVIVSGRNFTKNSGAYEVVIKYNPDELSLEGDDANYAVTVLGGFQKAMHLVTENQPGEIIIASAFKSETATASLNGDLIEIGFVAKSFNTEVSFKKVVLYTESGIDSLDKGIIKVIPKNMVLVTAGTTTFDNGNINVPNDYYVSKYEVTQGEYLALMNVNPSNNPNQLNNPVERITWYDAVSYCNKLSAKYNLPPFYSINVLGQNATNITSATVTELGGRGFRIPTNKEWEYAARGGNNGIAYIYSGSNDRDAVSWNTHNSGNAVIGNSWTQEDLINNNNRTHEVGTKQANGLGVYDMSGNVWEWTSATVGSEMVIRGGSYCSDTDEYYKPSSGTYNFSPSTALLNVGLRVVASK